MDLPNQKQANNQPLHTNSRITWKKQLYFNIVVTLFLMK